MKIGPIKGELPPPHLPRKVHFRKVSGRSFNIQMQFLLANDVISSVELALN